jgi:hypothetical protein
MTMRLPYQPQKICAACQNLLAAPGIMYPPGGSLPPYVTEVQTHE